MNKIQVELELLEDDRLEGFSMVADNVQGNLLSVLLLSPATGCGAET